MEVPSMSRNWSRLDLADASSSSVSSGFAPSLSSSSGGRVFAAATNGCSMWSVDVQRPTGCSNATEWETASVLSPGGDIAVACFLILVDVAAVSLNLLVLVVAIKNRKLLNHADAFIVSLAASDLGHPLFGYPMIIVSSFHHRWIFSYTWCQVNGFLGFLFGTNSMMTLACMSFTRLVSVTRPNTARHKGKCLTTTFLIFAVLYAIFWSTCPLLGWGRYDLEPYRTSCTLQWDFPDRSFVTASFVGCLAVPAAIMCLSYGQITALAWQTGKKQRRWTQRKLDKKVNKQELRLLKMTVAMCTVFVLVWSPYAISAMIRSYSRTVPIPTALTALPAMAAKSSHVIDPILYFALNKRFRRFLPRTKKADAALESGLTQHVVIPLRANEVADPFRQDLASCNAVKLQCLRKNATEEFSFQILTSAEESVMLSD